MAARNRHAIEYLAFRGRLHPDLHFELVRSYSTFEVRRWPRVEHPEYFLELRDERENTLLREPVSVNPSPICEPGIAPYWRVQGYLALREGAHELIFQKGDVPIRSFRVPERPRLSLEWKVTRVRRGRRTLRAEYSRPGEGAFIQLVYQWGPRRFQNVGFYRPRRELAVDLGELPGGKRCRLVALYSNGLRAAGAATRYFSLPPHGPTVEIVHPRDGEVLPPWVPLELEADVSDPEAGPPQDDEILWLLDGREMCRGATASLEKLAEGRHRLTLRYMKGKTRRGESSCAFRVRRPARLKFAPADEWEERPKG